MGKTEGEPAGLALPGDVRAAFGRAASHLLVPLVAALVGQDREARDETAHAAVALAAVHLLPPGMVDDIVTSAAASVTILEAQHRRGESTGEEAAAAIRAVCRALPVSVRARLSERGWVIALSDDDPLAATRARAT